MVGMSYDVCQMCGGDDGQGCYSTCPSMAIPRLQAEIDRLQEQVDRIKVVKQSRVIPEYELHNMNVANQVEYMHHVKDKLALRFAHELIAKNFITFEKTDWNGQLTVTATLKVLSNES